MAVPTYILIHVFGTVRDELDREEPDKRKRTYSAWLRDYVAEQPQRLTQIARLVDVLTENGWRVIGSPYDCDVMLERDISRQTAEEELRRAEVWDILVRIASPDDDGHVIWREHPEGKPAAPRRRRRVRRPPTREQGS
ncbi:MAG: hypothetical protein M3P38_05910 [Chloroflexota bacterium]|nr:hypothetical protein [Chloroflexota bacterium]